MNRDKVIVRTSFIGILANILGASTRAFHEQAFGEMLIGVPLSQKQAALDVGERLEKNRPQFEVDWHVLVLCEVW